MLDAKKLEQIARQIHQAMPQGLRDFGDDAEKKIRQILQGQLTRLDVVSREDFDLQSQLLQRTREKVLALEQRLNALETTAGQPNSAAVTTEPASLANPVSENDQTEGMCRNH